MFTWADVQLTQTEFNKWDQAFSVMFIHVDGCFLTELDLIHVAQIIQLQSRHYVLMCHEAQSILRTLAEENVIVL